MSYASDLTDEQWALLERVGRGDPGARDPALSDSLVGLLADAEAEDGGVARPRAADWFQVCPRKARGREADAVAEQNRQYIHQDLVDEPPLQALAGHVGAEDFEVLAAGSVHCRGDRFADVAGEDRDVRVRRLQRPMSEEEHGSGEGVVDAARLLGLHPVAYLPSPPADEHGAGGRCDLREIVRCHEVGESAIKPPVHGMAGTGDEAVKRHTPVHDNLAAHLTTAIPGVITARPTLSRADACETLARGVTVQIVPPIGAVGKCRSSTSTRDNPAEQ